MAPPIIMTKTSKLTAYSAARLVFAAAAACGLALTLPACVTNQGSAKAMYAAQYKCPQDQLEYENLGGYRAILVRGCGYEQVYACTTDATCVRDGDRTPVASGGLGMRTTSAPVQK